jgi:hypothetical protein
MIDQRTPPMEEGITKGPELDGCAADAAST